MSSLLQNKSMASFLCFFIFLLASSVSACDRRCIHQSKASYFSSASALSSGACGYGSLALDISGGNLAGGVPSLFKNGSHCGTCFQIRCKNQDLCTKEGTRVVLTDLNNNNQTDFVLSSRAFMAMAQNGKGQQVLKLGIVDIEYKRVPCVYQNKNLAIHVEETSNKPNYLAITFLYEGGQTEIVEVDVAQVGSSNWKSMSRNHGAVWDISSVPQGSLQFRLVVTLGYDGAFINAKKILPADWKNGMIYDLGVQIKEINEQDGCGHCDDGQWS